MPRDPEKQREYNRKWRERNPEKRREHDRKYHERNREKRSEYNRKWNDRNREKRREYNRKWRERNPEKQREHDRKRCDRNPEKHRERQRERAGRMRKIIDEVRDCPCMDCGQKYLSCVMEFHHRNPEEKYMNVTAMTSHSEEKIREEIEKCDLLCANCHRIRHHNESALREVQQSETPEREVVNV